VANHKSAEKRARQTVKKTIINNKRKTTVKTAVKAVREALVANDKTKAVDLLPKAQSLINKLAKNGVIKKKTASRKTARIAKQVSKLSK